MNTKFFVRILALTLAATALNSLLAEIFYSGFHWKHTAWILLSDFLIVLVMSLIARSTTVTGFRRMLALMIISFTIGCANILIEALIFYVTDRNETLQGILVGFIRFGILSAVIGYVFKEESVQKNSTPHSARGIFGWMWRIAACMFLYVIVYFVAGTILQLAIPNLLEYYDNKVPPVGLILGTQFFRGLVFSGIALLLLRYTTLAPEKKALLVGLTFAVLGGIAPLIPPNELMHQAIRIGHGFETGISNFVYGWMITLILSPRAGQAGSGANVSPPRSSMAM